MKLSWEIHGAIALLVASGDFVTDGADSLRRTVSERFEQGARSVVLDLSNITIIDSAALESLLWLAEETARLGGALRLVSPQHSVREALRLTRLTERFECAESVELAARSMR
ncbi:MAG: anti-sigma factor antagonist [Planctomycetota bacterium]|jgi:anti-anti-sigma factor|nr:MAG: anti-sigma factor antagonist [Planctomycetota bacterium]RLS96033.1 MAG: anti-sigma factor antagonist [Planctomycetota bacterium]